MLDLDFRSGVVITYRVGVATQACLRWRNRFLFVMVWFSPWEAYFRWHVTIVMFPFCDVNSLNIHTHTQACSEHCVYLPVCLPVCVCSVTKLKSKEHLVSFISYSLFCFRPNDLRMSIRLLLCALVCLERKLSSKYCLAQSEWWKYQACKQTNTSPLSLSPSLFWSLSNFLLHLKFIFRAFQRFQSCSRLFPLRSAASSYLFLDVSSNVVVACQLGRNVS